MIYSYFSAIRRNCKRIDVNGGHYIKQSKSELEKYMSHFLDFYIGRERERERERGWEWIWRNYTMCQYYEQLICTHVIKMAKVWFPYKNTPYSVLGWIASQNIT